MSYLKSCGLFSVVLAALAFTGCRQATSPQPAAEQETVSTGDSAQAEIEAALAKLPEEDRAAAQEQEICPVSGESLGSMGTPIKLDMEGRDVFICCAGCEDALRTDPEKYLSKLDVQE